MSDRRNLYHIEHGEDTGRHSVVYQGVIGFGGVRSEPPMFEVSTKVVAVYRVIGSVGKVTKGVSPPNMGIWFSLGKHDIRV